MKKLSLIIFCLIGLSFFNPIYSQNSDSLKRKEKINLILGVKLFLTQGMPEIRTASNIGADLYVFKNKKISLGYRNFFSAYINPRETTVFNKNVSLISTSNCFSFCYQIPTKSSYVKFGLGPYSAREQDFTDQYIFLNNPQGYGLEFTLYSKLKWLNVGYRHQIQLFHIQQLYLGLNEIFRFSLCIEVPIGIK